MNDKLEYNQLKDIYFECHNDLMIIQTNIEELNIEKIPVTNLFNSIILQTNENMVIINLKHSILSMWMYFC